MGPQGVGLAGPLAPTPAGRLQNRIVINQEQAPLPNYGIERVGDVKVAADVRTVTSEEIVRGRTWSMWSQRG
jgi:hypothetical protein